MNIVPYKAEHLMALQLQEGQQYCSHAVTPEYAQYLESEWAFTAMEGGKIVAVGGVCEIWSNRGLAWMLVDRDAGKHFLALTRTVKQMLDLVPYQRVEADTPCEFKQGHRWLKMLGFELEAPRMRGHRVDGGDSSLYARVR